jgi:hypothetical protein
MSLIDSKSYTLSLVPNVIQEDANNKFVKEVNQKEIKEALDQMSLDKALGPDGFTARSYQNCWDIIKANLIKLIRKY